MSTSQARAAFLRSVKQACFLNGTGSHKEVVANLAGCKHFSGTSGGEKVTGGTVEQMSFPHYGDASEAFVVIFTVSGVRFYGGRPVRPERAASSWRSTKAISVPIEVSQFLGFVEKAVAKLR